MNTNKLKKVEDHNTILSLLTNSKENGFEVYMWKLVAGVKHLATVRIEAVRKMRNDFCIAPASGQEKLVQDLLGSQSYIDLYIPDCALLLRCGLKQVDSPVRYYLNFPDFVAQVERRKSLRLNVYESEEVKVTFAKELPAPRVGSQYFSKHCFDVSSGGFSFLISRPESKCFATKDSIIDVELVAGNWKTRVKAEVAMIKEIEPDEIYGFPYKVWKICCRFSEIDQISKKYLEKFIFERIKEEVHAING
ncbi:MAG: hypothetical protein AB7I27_05090 [Bacteriovoracaceae bacterium]